ncbi:polysaccharide deacetylase family protein [Oribacterium sp. P6A1]|uniref:polysaccharide deacetylase family protein n=1 Tax=Oribacterium sp. P6A1 TaxID=1410612 RepID=UPI000A53169A|nr:polysaccharide deacetylase family protein [Oribacterium sp. P6A1]
MSLKKFSQNNSVSSRHSDRLRNDSSKSNQQKTENEYTRRVPTGDDLDSEYKRESYRSERRAYDDVPENSEDFFLDSDTGSYDDITDYPDEEKSFDERLAERREAIRSRHRQNVRKRKQMRFSAILIAIDIVVVLVLGVMFFTGKLNLSGLIGKKVAVETTAAPEESTVALESDISSESVSAQEDMNQLIAACDIKAAMYDYDAAIETLSNSAYGADPTVQAKIQEYRTAAEACVPFDNSQVTHVFFHILCVDTDRAFTNDAAGKDFNQVMTTIPEFEAILQQMYDRGYVLVGLHDMAEIEVQPDGTEKMVKKQIMLPEGKKAFVMSEDDVCYYEYMEGKGFADKMVLDENGKLKLQYTDAAGNVSIGDYDIVPILDNFIEQHPDFSYRGAKAIIAFTGYNGVLGYRTDETYDESSPNRDPSMKANPNIADDRETCKVLMQALVDDGYELASHSWGHLNFTNRDLAALTKDTDRWERNVETLMPGNCDIILYPFGADIADWHPYTTENEKFNMLQNAGFRYFCNVDSNPAWVQFGSNFVRQGRRNLDGYRMWMDYSGQDSKLSDLMDVKTVFDTRRPTPITWN